MLFYMIYNQNLSTVIMRHLTNEEIEAQKD